MNQKKHRIVALLFGALPFIAIAQEPVPGQPASIVVRYFDPATGQEVNVPGTSYIQPNSTLLMRAEVLDGYGQPADLQRFPCTVKYEAWNNFAGSRQSGVINGDVIQTTEQMGPFQINASCEENPQVRSSADQLTVSTSQLAPRYGAAPDPGAGAGMLALGVGAAVVGAVAIGSALGSTDYSDGGDGGGSCYFRACVKSSISGSCDCNEFNESGLCGFPTANPGGACTDTSGATIALCQDGYSCVNGTCRTDC